MTRCWACRRDIPDDHSYNLFIRERWGHHEISLGVVLCMDCRFKVWALLGEIQDSVPELAMRSPARLQERMAQRNEELRLVRRIPSEAMVTAWIAEAKTLPRVVVM